LFHYSNVKRSNQVSLKDFELIKFLGKGAFGTVWLVKKKATGDFYAMKVVEWADRVRITKHKVFDYFYRLLIIVLLL